MWLGRGLDRKEQPSIHPLCAAPKKHAMNCTLGQLLTNHDAQSPLFAAEQDHKTCPNRPRLEPGQAKGPPNCLEGRQPCHSPPGLTTPSPSMSNAATLPARRGSSAGRHQGQYRRQQNARCVLICVGQMGVQSGVQSRVHSGVHSGMRSREASVPSAPPALWLQALLPPFHASMLMPNI